MKSKTFKKKLALNKKTVADLNNWQLGKVKGGALTPPTRCVDSVCVCPLTEIAETCKSCISCNSPFDCDVP